MRTSWSILKRQMRRRARASHESKVSGADGGVKTLRLLAVRVRGTNSLYVFSREKRVSEHWGTFLKIILN